MASKGVTILAFGHDSYAKWAWNLLVSIRATSPGIKVQLIHDTCVSTLAPLQLAMFDLTTTIDREYFMHNGRFSAGRAKIRAYELYAYDETIFIDADTIVLKDLNPLFDKCKSDITCQCIGYWNESTEDRPAAWMTQSKVRKNFNLPKKHEMYDINSSFMFVRKGKIAKEFFDEALKAIDSEIDGKDLTLWGGGFPDELAYQVSIGKNGIVPIFEGQVKEALNVEDSEPIFYPHKPSLNPLANEKYFMMTFYGDAQHTSGKHQGLYDRLMHSYCSALNLEHHYKIFRLINHKYVRTGGN